MLGVRADARGAPSRMLQAEPSRSDPWRTPAARSSRQGVSQTDVCPSPSSCPSTGSRMTENMQADAGRGEPCAGASPRGPTSEHQREAVESRQGLLWSLPGPVTQEALAPRPPIGAHTMIP